MDSKLFLDQNNFGSKKFCAQKNVAQKNEVTRLISIESQPKKIVVVDVVVIGVVVVVVHVVVFVFLLLIPETYL